jgi:hypothetical protein
VRGLPIFYGKSEEKMGGVMTRADKEKHADKQNFGFGIQIDRAAKGKINLRPRRRLRKFEKAKGKADCALPA